MARHRTMCLRLSIAGTPSLLNVAFTRCMGCRLDRARGTFVNADPFIVGSLSTQIDYGTDAL
jgi:hypothetical protein